ncbi:potassium channel family protein [Devriesea agamarum]|uniref:potassium channel family protein n=1 Tax=Devriesea agamarum TaxID=472569 RepID=UPI00071D1629|nr:TrkA family potassium uptake protein [Devriesea agamarum]
MHFVIMGCGRVGATLARQIEAMGHSVAVIDQDPRAFTRLGASFGGRCVTGIGFDRETLEEAQIHEAYSFAAVSSGDNSNVISARVARETFGVKHVVARIYDQRRAEVYERLGIATVASVKWSAAQVMRRMIPGNPAHEFTDVSGCLSMHEIDADPSWTGTCISDIERLTRGRVVYLTRLGDGVLVRPGDLLQEGDRIHLMAPVAEIDEAELVLAHRKDDKEG